MPYHTRDCTRQHDLTLQVSYIDHSVTVIRAPSRSVLTARSAQSLATLLAVHSGEERHRRTRYAARALVTGMLTEGRAYAVRGGGDAAVRENERTVCAFLASELMSRTAWSMQAKEGKDAETATHLATAVLISLTSRRVRSVSTPAARGASDCCTLTLAA